MKINEIFGSITTDCPNPKIKKHDREVCLIEKFYEREAKKPVHLRSKICMISCPCSKCSPQIL